MRPDADRCTVEVSVLETGLLLLSSLTHPPEELWCWTDISLCFSAFLVPLPRYCFFFFRNNLTVNVSKPYPAPLVHNPLISINIFILIFVKIFLCLPFSALGGILSHSLPGCVVLPQSGKFSPDQVIQLHILTAFTNIRSSPYFPFVWSECKPLHCVIFMLINPSYCNICRIFVICHITTTQFLIYSYII